MTDLAVVGQDPRYGDGVAALLGAFFRGAREVGREPHLFDIRHPSLAGRHVDDELEPRTELPAVAARVDAVHQVLAGRRLAPLVHGARSLWVVATLASYGYAAVRARRPYACWIGTTLAHESSGRRHGLDPVRRAALHVSAPVLGRLERDVLRAATAVYAISPDAARRVGASARREVRVLPIPVDIDALTPGHESREPTLVFVGRASDPRKGVDRLLAALPHVREAVPDTRLRLIGEPPRAAVPDGVEVAGRVPSIADELRRAGLFVLPSRQEGFGIVAAEALACATPVVATPSGGPEELLRASGGGRVVAPELLAETIVDLLRDEELRAEMGRSGRAYVEREHSHARFRERLAAAFADEPAG